MAVLASATVSEAAEAPLWQPRAGYGPQYEAWIAVIESVRSAYLEDHHRGSQYPIVEPVQRLVGERVIHQPIGDGRQTKVVVQDYCYEGNIEEQLTKYRC